MTLNIYNTLSRRKEIFEPLKEDTVGMYVCGPTVYNHAHIGNARPVIVFDILYRLLSRLYGTVTYVRNITDVDDKINARAKQTGEDIRVITERTAKDFNQDMKALGALAPDVEPRATDHIAEMIELAQALIGAGNAYEADGHVLFSVPSWDGYGKLSGNSRDEIIAGSRVEVAPYKKDAADFVLWKPSGAELPGWDSPWGRGRPGWHLECSAMSRKYLGRTFDIHGGGQDLIFPHHENEIAQSCCAHGTEIMAKYWMHNGYLMAEGEKMSKSLGNFYTVHELLEKFPGEAIRLTLLKTHYRQPLDFTKAGIAEAKRELDRFYGALQHFSDIEPDSKGINDVMVQYALEDDLNTPKAISVLRGFLRTLNSFRDPEGQLAGNTPERIKAALLKSAEPLGLLQQDPEDWFKWAPKAAGSIPESEIEALIAERIKAREKKDFAAADRIRDMLAEKGVSLEDSAGETIWKRI